MPLFTAFVPLDVTVTAGFTFLATHPELKFPDFLVGGELVCRPFNHNLAVFYDVTVGSDRQGNGSVLFH